MADFDLNEYKKKNDDYWKNRKEEQDQRLNNRYENTQKYGIKLTDEQYKSLNGLIANAKDPVEEAHKIGLAITYAEQTGSSIPECYQKVDDYNASLFGPDKSTSYRGWWTVLGDALSMGANNVRLGQLGTELRRANRNGDTEKAETLKQEIDALNADNALKYDNAPRSWVTNVLKTGAQTLPYTGYIAGAEMFGGFFAGPVGMAAAFGAGTQLMSGQEYIDMLDKGISEDIADRKSIISGGLQSLVETALGQVGTVAGVGLKVAGKNPVGKPVEKMLIEKLSKTLQQRFHFGASKQVAIRAITGWLFDIPEEGVEEFLQQGISDKEQNKAVRLENKRRDDKRTEEEKAIQLDLAAQKITDAVAEDLIATLQEEYPELEEKQTKEILKDSLEAFKGGVEGAIALGFFTAGANTVVDNVNLSKIKNLARDIPSKEMFKSEMTKERVDKNGNAYTYADVLRQEDPSMLNNTLDDLWESQGKSRDEVNYSSVRDIAEINTAAEGYEDPEVDEETGEKKVTPVQRNEQGELDAENVITENEDGTSHLQYRVGTASKSDKNLYGYIDATINKDNDTITINKFSMDLNREGLRQEVYEQFAADNAGYKIEWNTKGKSAAQLKKQLIENNLNGKNNGLTYYKDVNDVNDSYTRRNVAKQVRNNVKNIAPNQVPAAVAYMENLAKSRNMTLTEYYNKNFSDSMFGNMEEAEAIANANQETTKGKRGGTSWRVFGNEVKAVIYAGEHADFSTFVHELAHVWQQALSRDAEMGDEEASKLLKLAEDAFGVQDHNWRNSTFKFNEGVGIDKKYHTASEAFAYGLEDYLKTGKANSNDLSTLFKQLAQFVASTMRQLANYITLSPEIKSFYDEMMKNDSNEILAKAYRDSIKADREIRETENAKQKEQAKQQAEQEKVKQAEAKDQEEVNFKQEDKTEKEVTPEPTPLEKNMPTPSEVASAVETLNETEMDATNEDIIANVEKYTAEQQTTQEVDNLVNNATGNVGPEEMEKTLTDQNETLAGKEEAGNDAADISNKIDNIAFQVMNESLFNTLNQSMFKNQLAAELYAAKNNINKVGGVNNRQARKTIKNLYDWEYKNNQWYLETHDDKIKVDMDAVKPYLYGNNPNSIRLDAFYNDPEMFTLIPQLKELKVSFINDIDEAAALSKFENKELVINKARFGKSGDSQVNLRNAIIYSMQVMLNEASELTPQKIAYFPNSQEVLARVVVTRSLQKAKYRNGTLLDEYDPAIIDFQAMGELGATALDRAENTTYRLDNKNLAEQMEKDGKTPEEIRFATGWERGRDGLWRWETNDLYAKFSLIYKELQVARDFPRYNELQQKLEKSYNGGEALTEAEVTELDEIQDIANAMYNKDAVKLKDILDYPELYKAYPQLADMDVIFKDYETQSIKASYATGTYLDSGAKINFITISNKVNSYNETDFNRALLHEIQHAIQDIEGFAVGGDPETATEMANKAKDAFDIVHFYDEIESKYKENPEFYAYHQMDMLDDIIKEYRDADVMEWLPEERLRNKAFNYWTRGYGIEEEQKIVKDNGLDIRVPKVSSTGFQNYRRLAGEVEARNTANRYLMTDEERRNTLLSKTADVAPYDQIVFFDAERMNSIEEETNKDKEYSEAVNSGNIDKAKNMLEEEAIKKGYITQSYFGEGSWAAPTAGVEKDQFTDLDALQQYVEDYGDEVNIYGIINGVQAHQEDYYFNPDRAGFHGQAASDTAQVLRKLRYDKADPNTKVTVYRAVPNDVNGEKLLSGDWIALSKNYCEEHGNNRYGAGNYHIIEQEVPITNIWQGAEDMREFGYDDGNKDVEKNIKNNRKLLEITYDENGNLIPLSQRFNEDIPNIDFQQVTDPEEIAKLEAEKTIKAYRAAQIIDGEIYPPMSAKVNGKLRDPIKLDKWERADENPNLADEKGMMKLNKGNGKTILARYNPYIHSSPDMLNDQFSEAQDRDNLIVLEVEIPLSELTSENPYKAEKAKDTVGTKEWKAGIIQSQLTGTRKVNLSRYDKPIRIVPNEEVAKNIVKSFKGKNIIMPSNVVTPSVRVELEKLGVKFVETTNKGILKDGEYKGIHYSKVYANNPSIDFQTAYHGSAADFDKFDTENFGYSGEGSMSFGYGTYVTGSEEIARDYAHRQAVGKAKIEDLWIQTIAENMGANKTLEEAKQESIDNIKKLSLSSKSEQNKIIKQIQAITEEDLKDVIGKRNLYSVDIPDSGFIKWDKDVNSRTIEKVKRELLKEIYSTPDSAYYNYDKKELSNEFDSVFQYVQGQQLYNNVSAYLEGDEKASRFLNKIGYMGIDYPAGSIHGNGDNARNFVIFNDADAKIINKMLFQEDGSLYGVHNLSEDAIKHVFKMGGLANPSLAVVDKDVQIHENFGDISLIAYNSFINKSTGNNAGTYGADIYSPRYPSITRTVTDTGRTKLKVIYNSIEDEDLKSHFIENTKQKFENDRKPDFEYTDLPIEYLVEKGNKAFWQYEKSEYSDEVKELIKTLGPTPNILAAEEAEIVKIAYRKYLEGDYEQRLKDAQESLKTETKSWRQKVLQKTIEQAQERLDIAKKIIEEQTNPDTGNLNYNIADNFVYKVRRSINSAGKVDVYATERAARELVENDPEFKKWAEEKYNSVEMDEKIFNGYTPSGNRRYLTHTLENVSKFMKQEATRGGENFNYGMGSARALVTPKFTTLKQIRDNKDRLTDTATFEKIKEELSNEYDWVTDRLRGSLSDFDAGAYRYAEAIENGYFNANYIAKEYPDVELTENEVQRITEFTEALKEMPTEYFETKYNRPVYTEDFGTSFAAAVLPETTDPEVIKKLEDQGIMIFKYNNADDRASVTRAALTTVNMTRDVLWQTQAELYNDAMQFDNWKDFMESYTMDFNPEALEDPNYHNQVPSDADAQWYQTTWELAHGIVPEEATSKTEVAEKYEKEGPIPTVLDAMFDTDMATNEGMLENFLLKIYEIRNFNFNAPDFMQPQDQEEEEYFNKLQQMQDFLNTRLSNVSFITQSTHYAKTGELSVPARKQLISLIEGNTREYRALYSEIMDDPNYAVEEEDLPRNYLAKKLRKYRLVSPNADLERKSIDEINRLSKELSNREIAEKVAKKTLRMDDELSNYVASLNNQIKELQQQYDDLEKETTADYQRIADDEKRKLLRLHEQLLLARHNYNKKNDKVTRLIEKGIKISGKYKQNVQNYKADYDEIFRKYQDLYTTVDLTKEVEAALKRQEDLVTIREDLNAKSDEKNLAAEIKRLRVQLVKRTMRRVPFERIDYENARTLIAIQRMLEPNLFGGVNRWIGTEGPYLRGVISGILTDEEYKNEILRYLDKTARSSQSFADFKKLLMETKTIADFDKWTNKQRKAAIRYLPKENWIRDLNLKQLAKEREDSIDLPIDMVEVQRPMKDNNGNVMTKKDGTPIMVTTFELKTTPEIERLVKDAVGDAMYNNIVSRPFAEWTTEEMEQLAIRVNQIYTEGRDILAAKKLAKIHEAEQIRQRIEQAVKNTGIVINDDDTPEEKAKKQAKIDKILGLNDALHGTAADTKKQSRINRLLHGYADANILRVARILDNYSEGENVNELYRKENNCYNAKQRSINARAIKIQQVMKENNIDEQLLNTKVNVHDAVYNQDFEFTIDELLYILAANEDYVDDDTLLAKGELPGTLEANDDYAATSRNAVMFGNMFSSTKDLQEKEEYAQMDKTQKELIETEDPMIMQLKALNKLDATPGTTEYKGKCKGRFQAALLKAKEIEAQYPGLIKLREAVAEDYTQQYERMNEVSVEVLNAPVHRVKCYVPLVRLESNGDTNENQVKEDLLGTAGVGKEWVNKGMTQRRVNTAPLNQKPVQMGLHKTWTNSVERTEHFIAYTDYVRELNRVYKSRDAQFTKNFIENRYGKGMVEYLNQYINEVANPNANKVRTAGDDFIRTFRGHTAPAYLSWKVSAIVKQGATSPWPYMQFVNPAEYMAASWKCITSGGKLYEAIREKSVFMNNRVMDPMNDLIKEMAENSKNKFTRTFNKINEKGMAGLEWIDWISVAPGWYACYLKKYNELNGKNTDVYEATKLRLEEENAYAEVGTSAWKSKDKIEALAMQAMKDDVETRAVEYADDCTRQCQPSNRSVDIAPLFKNSSEAMKAYLQFQTSLNVIWQNLRYDLPYAAKNKQFQRIAGTVIGYVLAGVMMNAIMEGWPNGDDDEPEDVLKQFIWYSTTQFTDSVPMLGSALTTANQKLITGKSTYFGSSGTDMTPMVTKFINAATSTSTAIRNSDDEEKAKKAWMKAAQNFAEGLNMSVGLPVSGVKEIEKLIGVGNKEPGLDLDLGSVYGIVNNITGQEDK